MPEPDAARRAQTSGLSKDDWSPLAAGRPSRHYAPGQLIYLQGTRAGQFYYIVNGVVRCFMASEEGDERTLTLHRAGELIGEAAFFDGEPRVSSAVAVTNCEVVSVDKAMLTEVFAQKPDLAISMLSYLARTVRILSAHVDSTFLSADRRIARHLLSLAGGRESVRCTHEDIGASVGVSRVTVSRVLGEFERRGWVETGYRSLRLLSPGALAEFAQTPAEERD